MDVSQRTATIAGISMIVLAICLVIFVVTGSMTGDNDPFQKDEVEKFLKDVHDNDTAIIVGSAVGIVIDGFVGLIVAAAIFVLFRDRSPFLATVALVGFVANSAVSLVVDGSQILLTIIADDFVKGGAGGIPANDPAVLELGRYVGMITMAFFSLAFTSLGLALIALGLIILYAPGGIVNPPRWLGWIALIGGVSADLSWFVVAVDPAFVFFPISFLASFILLAGLGIWLVRNGDLQPAPMKA